MKKVSVFILFAYCLLPIAYSQVKTQLATVQKTFGGMGGVTMNYVAGIKSKGSDSLVIDSVTTAADKSRINIYYNKTERLYAELAFSFALSAPPKCKTCPDTSPRQQNLTKGIIIFGRKGEKKFSLKVKKFKELPELRLP